MVLVNAIIKVLSKPSFLSQFLSICIFRPPVFIHGGLMIICFSLLKCSPGCHLKQIQTRKKIYLKKYYSQKSKTLSHEKIDDSTDAFIYGDLNTARGAYINIKFIYCLPTPATPPPTLPPSAGHSVIYSVINLIMICILGDEEKSI